MYHKNKSIISKTSATDSAATWRLYIDSSGYDINYYFVKKDEKWYLDYYSHQNL